MQSALLQYRWPKCHDHVVEQCRVVNVRDLLRDLPPHLGAVLRAWSPPTYPQLVLVPGRGGAIGRLWWFECPHCGRRCENLYIPPGIEREDWKCRRCANLIYASQRYGYRHPLRKKLTHRKRATMLKRVLRIQRRLAQLTDRQKQAEQAKRSVPSVNANLTAGPASGDDYVREDATRAAITRQVHEMLDAGRERNLAFLTEVARGQQGPRSVRAQAARLLKRAGEGQRLK